MSDIFISHAAADKPLVDEFVDTVVRLGCGVPEERVFYSSGTGIDPGRDLNAELRVEVGDAKVLVAMITRAFLDSPYCLVEMGAAWGRVGTLFPFVYPVALRTQLDGVLSSIVVPGLDDTNGLDALRDRIGEAVGVHTNARTWGRYKRQWLDTIRRTKSPAGRSRRRRKAASGVPQPLRYTWGELFDSVVDAALYTRDDRVARTEIESHVENRTLIPSKYHYSSDSGADNWIRLCQDPSYQHHINTTEFWAGERGQQMATLISEHVASGSLDFISLGPGDGQKDAALVDAWLKEALDVFYYPYDISLPLASKAVQHVRERTRSNTNRKLHIKAALADFRHLRTMRDVFAHRTAPNVVGLLGSLGNLERDRKFLRELRETMGRGDVVVLEVRLKSKSEPPELSSPSSLRFDFGPLDYFLGIEFHEDLVRISRRDGASAIPNTETTVVSCEGAMYKGQKLHSIPLQYIHRYDPDAFLTAVRSDGFQVVGEPVVDEAGAFLECVLQPNGRRKRTR
jgi:hypothetical protein